MRTNLMSNCGAGAMLVGCTLAMTHDASAGVTWLATTFGGSSSALYIDSQNSAFYDYKLGADALAPTVTLQTSDGFAVDFATSSTGCSWAVTQEPSSNSSRTVSGYWAFSLTESVNWGFSGVAYDASNGNGTFVEFMKWDGSAWQAEGGTFYNGESGTLSAGSYLFIGITHFLDGTSAAGASSSLTFSAVPAPGAIALLGVAGLVGRRRR